MLIRHTHRRMEGRTEGWKDQLTDKQKKIRQIGRFNNQTKMRVSKDVNTDVDRLC